MNKIPENKNLSPEFLRTDKGKTNYSAIEIPSSNGDYVINEDDEFTIRFYRPRIEGLFAGIERWTYKKNGRIQ